MSTHTCEPLMCRETPGCVPAENGHDNRRVYWNLALIDDVIIHGKTKEEHDLNLRKLMETSRTAGLIFNSNKCAINQEQVRFFGTIFHKNGILPNPPKSGGNKITPQSN